jgi:hypothetical protein
MSQVPPGFVMGLNFSNSLQSKPIDPSKAAFQILKLVEMVKFFAFSDSEVAFLKALKNNAPSARVAVGSTLDQMLEFANNESSGWVDLLTSNTAWPWTSWICVGNEPLGSWYNGQYNNSVVPAVQGLYNSLTNAGVSGVGVTVPQNFDFMQISYPPSAGAIKPELVDIIKGTCQVMRDSGAPFMVNIYPYLDRKNNPRDIPLDYCLFTAGPDHWVTDGPYTYKNIFDASLDALQVALDEIGYGDLEIVVGECGWPTAGGPDASPENAKTFVQNLIKHCKSGSGTPRFPNRIIRCFVFEAYDEDLKDTSPGEFERHWGVFDDIGNAKYPLSW